MNLIILKVLVGSKAHGLDSIESDIDIRSIFVQPTSEILSLNTTQIKNKNIDAPKENVDNVSYEISHFLKLAVGSNPSILEIFKAPIIKSCQYGEDLRKLFDLCWNSRSVYYSFSSYSHDQHKKMFDEKVELARRKFKYAVAHLRVLIQGIELLQTGNFSVVVKDHYLNLPIHFHVPYWIEEAHKTDSWLEFLKMIRDQKVTVRQVADVAEYLKGILKESYEMNPNKMTDLDPINDFLLKIRKEYW